MAKATATVSSIARLQHDLRELQREPLDGIFAQPLESNIHEWHINMLPGHGQYQDIIFHMVLTFPQDYPSNPPKVNLCTKLIHPNVFYWSFQENGYPYICLDMIKPPEDYARPGAGWSAAYSARTILMQLYGFLLVDDKIEQEHGGVVERSKMSSYIYNRKDPWQQCRRSAEQFSCSGCSHTWQAPCPPLQNVIWPPQRSVSPRPAAPTLNAWLQPALHRLRPSPASTATNNVLSFTASSQHTASSSSGGSSSSSHGSSASSSRSPNTPTSSSSGPPTPATSVSNTPTSQRYARAAQAITTKPSAAVVAAAATAGPNMVQLQAPTAKPGSQPRAPTTNQQAAAPPATDLTSLLDDHMLRDVLSKLPVEDLWRCGNVSLRFANLGRDARQRRELFCFYSKLNYQQAILGYGVARQWHRETSNDLKALTSPLDLLSWDAFQAGIRRSAWNICFDRFLPLYLNPEHGSRALPLVPVCVKAIILKTDNDAQEVISQALSKQQRQQGQQAQQQQWAVVQAKAVHKPVSRGVFEASAGEVLHMLAMLMNTLAVQLVQPVDTDSSRSGVQRKRRGLDDLWYMLDLMNEEANKATITRSMSDAAIASFCHLHHLLLAMALQPGIGQEMLAQAQWDVVKFIQQPGSRCKAKCPDLGILLVKYMLTPISAASWEQFAPALLRETLSRQVLWAGRSDPRFYRPAGDVPGRPGHIARLSHHFHAAKVSLRNLMFQAWFANALARPTTPKDLARIKAGYDECSGLPPAGHFEAFNTHARQVLKCGNWAEFLAHMRLSIRDDLDGCQVMAAALRQAVVDSARKEYHKADANILQQKFLDWQIQPFVMRKEGW